MTASPWATPDAIHPCRTCERLIYRARQVYYAFGARCPSLYKDAKGDWWTIPDHEPGAAFQPARKGG